MVAVVNLDADLIAYYEAEARGRLRTVRGAMRSALRSSFAARLRSEGRRAVVDVGAGPGLDAEAWSSDGFDVVGIDLTHANAVLMSERDLRCVTGSLYQLPFRTGAFDALWTMSTFVHVPHVRFDAAIEEMLRVVRPGAPLGIGTWGGVDLEAVQEVGELRPYRFFSLATHDRWQAMLTSHGSLDSFETFAPDPVSGWEYQFAVLRSPC